MPITDLAGKTAVVTGAASGIGLGLALRFAREGMNVVLADIEAGALDAAVVQVRELGGQAIGVTVDVRDPEQIEGLAEQTVAEFGGVALLCNNAGVESGASFSDLPLATWKWVMDVNFFGILNGCRTFLPLLEREPEGHIVNTASMASFWAGVPTFGPYIASKFAILGMSESLSMELADTGSTVGISVVTPGAVKSRITEAERNLPEGVPSNGGNAATKAMMDSFRAILAVEGMEPDTVAGMVVDAVQTNSFYVLTHPDEALAAVGKRLDWITNGTNPVRA